MSTVVTAGSPGSFQFTVIDFANPANPVSVKPSFQDPCQVNQDGAIAYVGNLNGGQVQRFDISNPAQPVAQGTAPTVLTGINSVAIRGTLVAVGEETNDFKARICLIDFAIPNQPAILGYAQTPLISVTGKNNLPAISQLAFIGPNHVVASGPANFIIAIADFTVPANPIVTTFNPPAPPSLDADEDIQRIVTGDTTASWVRLYDTSLNLLATANSTLNSVDYISLSGLRALAGSNNTFQVALIDFSVTPPGVTIFDPQVGAGGGGSCTVIKGTRGACGAVLASDVELFDVTASPPAPLGTANTNLAGVASLGIGTVAPVLSASPASLAFGVVNVNTTSQAQTVALANTGNAPLNVTALATSSPRYTAAPSGALPAIAAGQSTTVQVTFTPTAVQSDPAALTMTTNDPSQPSVSIPLTGSGGQAAAAWTPASMDFGTVETGATASLNLTVASSGSATLHVTGITASLPVFSASPTQLSVAPGESQTIQVSFSPAAARNYTATLAFQTDDPSHVSVNVPMAGTGSLPAVTWTPASITFGAVPQGSAEGQELVIANNGTADLHITNAQVTYSRAGEQDGFSVSPASLTIPPGQSGSLVVTFTPLGSWPWGYDASGDLIFQTDDLGQPSVDVPVSGTQQPWGCLAAPLAPVARAYRAATRIRAPRRR